LTPSFKMDDTQEVYLLHQTPPALARQLVSRVPLVAGDVVGEPFRGEGAFYEAFPPDVVREWAEIREGRDYRTMPECDWVITNPPFQISGENSVFPLLDYFTQRTRKGVAMLVNDRGFSTLTPPRLVKLQERGWALTQVWVCAVPKWRGRYYFMVWERGCAERGVVRPLVWTPN
jgi:hypothetical protein